MQLFLQSPPAAIRENAIRRHFCFGCTSQTQRQRLLSNSVWTQLAWQSSYNVFVSFLVQMHTGLSSSLFPATVTDKQSDASVFRLSVSLRLSPLCCYWSLQYLEPKVHLITSQHLRLRGWNAKIHLILREKKKIIHILCFYELQNKYVDTHIRYCCESSCHFFSFFAWR